MRMRLFIGMAVASLALATAAFAYPGLNATTGLIGVPNAHVVGDGVLEGAADVLFLDEAVVNARAVLGFSDRFEAGAGVVLGDDNGLILNAKYLLPLAPGGFEVATGLSYLTADTTGNGFQLYFAGTRAFPGAAPEGTRLLGTLGVSFTDLEDATAIRPFVAAQLLLGSRTEIGGEFELEAGDFNESISSIYLRQRLTTNWSAQLGFTNANGFIGTDDHDFFLGASYRFGGGATAD